MYPLSLKRGMVDVKLGSIGHSACSMLQQRDSEIFLREYKGGNFDVTC